MNVIRQKIKYFLNQFFASPLSSQELSTLCFNRQIEIIDDITVRVTLMNTKQLSEQYEIIFLPLIEKLCNASPTLASMLDYPELPPTLAHEPWQFTVACDNEETMIRCVFELEKSILNTKNLV